MGYHQVSLSTSNDFTQDWTSSNIENWKLHLAQFRQKPVDILEIGSFEGRSAVFFLDYLLQSKITCIDTFEGSVEHLDPSSHHYSDTSNIENRFDKNLARYGTRVEKLKGQSEKVLRGIRNRKFDLIYIDGDHSASGVFADATACWPLLREGGVIIFDDYLWEPHLPSELRPQSGIDSFLKIIEGQYTLIDKNYQVIISRKAPRRAIATRNDGNGLNYLELPIVSFILVNWNYARYIGHTIDSIAAQDYPNLECVIVDNGSDDDSLEIIEKHVKGDSRFSVLSLPSNYGQLGAVFKGLREITGRFLVVVDSDDVLFPNFASTHVQVHLAAPENVAITSSNIIEIDESGKLLSSQYAHICTTRHAGIKGLRPSRSVARLSSISESEYAHLNEVSRTLSFDSPNWLWSPGTSNMIRTTAAQLFYRNDGKAYMRASDNYFLPLCHSVGGTTIIDTALSAYRIHGKNYYSASESIRGFNSGVSEHTAKLASHYFQNMETLLSNPQFFAERLGSRFWIVLDNIHLSAVNQGTPGYFELFLRQAEPLRRAVGNRSFVEQCFSRFEISKVIKILAASAKGNERASLFRRFLKLQIKHSLKKLTLRKVKSC